MAGKLTERLKREEITIDDLKPGKYGDGSGLQFVVSPSPTDRTKPGARKWVFRYMRDGRAREMGLGSYPELTLSKARNKALEARRTVRVAGADPIDAKRKTSAIPTFGELADELTGELSKGFKNEKHRAQWKTTLTTYCDMIRSKKVDEIDTEDVLKVLQPIWQSKAETASRLRGRIEHVLAAATAKKFRSGENPAAWRGHLDKLLPKRLKLTRGHHAAMAYKDVPAFIGRLRERDAMAALAMEFVILTACRTGEVLGARWQEIDLGAKVWTIPGERMKAGRDHAVPLSDRAVEIVKRAAELKRGDFVFVGPSGSPLTGAALDALRDRMSVSDVTTHGFRSSFRDWAGNETSFPRELAEHALAHVLGDKAEQAYRRGTALERRRELMAAWARHCEPTLKINVVALRAS